MKKSSALLFVAPALGWAIRGHFSHEYGAAWPGAMARSGAGCGNFVILNF